MVIDFWATWCGPCRTLGPMLEKAVQDAKGAVKLVKIDMDKNPVYAGQLQVQSIPAVFAITRDPFTRHSCSSVRFLAATGLPAQS